MLNSRPHKNKGPCVICGKENYNEKFRKLTPNLLQKALKSLNFQDLTVDLNYMINFVEDITINWLYLIEILQNQIENLCAK